jgi:hypothetical protein
MSVYIGFFVLKCLTNKHFDFVSLTNHKKFKSSPNRMAEDTTAQKISESVEEIEISDSESDSTEDDNVY